MRRRHSRDIIVALLLGTLALIGYGSLYPFDLKPGAHSISIWQAFGQVSWARGGRGDRILNVLLYVPLGFCLFLWLNTFLHRRSAILLAIISGTVLSFGVEVTQVFIDQRVASYWDVTCNGIGSIIGAIAGVAWQELTSRLDSTTARRGRVDRSAVLIVLLWLAWRLWPFIPQFDIGKLKAAFSPLADPYFSTIATLHYLAWWTLLAQIVFVLVSERRSIEALLALIAIVLAACLGINYHGFIPSELLALVLLLPTLLVFNRMTPTPRRWLLLAAFVGLLAYDSFVPFQFSSTPGYFDLWPFIAWIDSGFPIDWEWLARRACYFAAFTWVLKEAGMPLRMTTIFVPIVALGIEIVQIWIPGQRASITEPILAFMVAWLMRALAGSREREYSTLQRARSR